MLGRKARFIEKEMLYKARIKELENIICPAEQHDYALVDKRMGVDEYGTVTVNCRYVCKRCLKTKET